MNKKRCIFCHRTEEEFDAQNQWSVEHIIPLSLGNTQLKIYCVCKECNSRLGRFIDNHFVDNPLIAIIRKELVLKGESGRIPNPFKEGKDQFGNKIRVDDSLNVSIVPKLSSETISGNTHYIINANSISEGKTMLATRLRREGHGKDYIEGMLRLVDDVAIHRSYLPKPAFDFSIDIDKWAVFFLKIAYEYSCLKLGELYFDDDTSINIRQFLYKVICGEANDIISVRQWVIPTPSEIFNSLSFAAPLEMKVHMLQLHPDKAGKLICTIYLFFKKLTSFSVLISDNAKNYLPLPQMDIIDIPSSIISDDTSTGNDM